MKRKINQGIIMGLVLSVFILMGASKTADAAVVEVGSTSDAYTQIAKTPTGDNITLKMSDNFSLGSFEFTNKNITFDLNGHTLSANYLYTYKDGGSFHIINSAYATSGGKFDINGDINVCKGAIIDTAQDGIINVSGYISAVDSGTSVTVNNVTCNTNAYPVTAGDGSTIVINGDITSSTGYSGGRAVSASGKDSSVTVNGNISISGNNCVGAFIDTSGSNAHITVNGKITAVGNNSYGIQMFGDSSGVTVTGDVTADYMGVYVGIKSSNRVEVDGSLTVNANNACGVGMGFGSMNLVDVRGDIVTKGTSARGVYVSNAYGDNGLKNNVRAWGNVITMGDTSTGVNAVSEGIINVSGNINTALKSDGTYTTGSTPVAAEGGSISVGGNVTSSASGVRVSGGGSVSITGNIEVYVPNDSYSYSAASISDDNGSISVGGNITISGTSTGTFYGIYGGYLSTGGTVRVYGNISVTNNAGSAEGIDCDSSRSVIVDQDVTASGAGATYGIVAYNAEVYVKGKISVISNSNNVGIYVSGSSTIKVDKSVNATFYIKSDVNGSPTTKNKGNGTFNSSTNYYNYSLGNAVVSIKGYQLTIAADTGGIAGIGSTTVTSGYYEAGTQLNIVASDTVTGYNFSRWSSTSDNYSDPNSAATTFTMPAEDTIVRAEFSEVSVCNIVISPAITGGTVAAKAESAEAGERVDLTITPDSGNKYVADSLYYSYNGHNYPLTVKSNAGLLTASFIMPEYEVSVTADFINITKPTITTSSLPSGREKLSYSQQLVHSSNTDAVWSIVSGTLPTGLSLSGDGIISGTPSQSGDYSFTVKASNGGGNDTQALSLTIKSSNPEFITQTLPNGTEDQTYHMQINADYIGTADWSVEGLPQGLGFDNGRISGSILEEITEEASYTIRVTVNSYYYNVTTFERIDYGETVKDFTLKVEPAPTHELSIEAGSNGKIISDSRGSYDKDQKVNIEAEPDKGYIFNGWISSNGGSFVDASSLATTFNMPDNATTVTARFVINPISPKQGITQYVKINGDGHFTASDIAVDANSAQLTITDIKSSYSEFSKYMEIVLNNGSINISGKNLGNVSINVTVSNGVVSKDITVPIIVEAAKLATPVNLGWNTDYGIYAFWDYISAPSYTLQLYKDGVPLGDEITDITDPYLDLTDDILNNGEGNYTFTVTAIGDGGEYLNSDLSDRSEEYRFSYGKINVTGVRIDQPLINVKVCSGGALTISIDPVDADNQAVTWLSSDTRIATVDDNGYVTGVSEGDATITVTTVDGGYQASITAHVTAQSVDGGNVEPDTIAVTGITLNQANLSLITGATYKLIADISPNTASNKAVSWSSSNPSVARVNDDGTVTAVTAGTAIITVTSKDGGYTATSTVNVSSPSYSDSGNSGNNGSGGLGGNAVEAVEPGDSVNLRLGGDSTKEWTDIIQTISDSSTTNFAIDMNDSTVVPKDLLETIQGKDVTVTLKLGEGIEWIINGDDIPETGASTDNTPLRNIDLNVTMNTNNIPQSLLSSLPDANASTVQLALSHEGGFGFHATLRINLASADTGRFASLYYYNTVSNTLELQSISPIGSDGYAQFAFAHASDYVILVDDTSTINSLAQQITITSVKKILYVNGTKGKDVELKVILPNQLQQLMKDGNCSYSVTFSSDKPSIATVSNGKVMAHKNGKALITVAVTVNGVTRNYQIAITVKNAYIKLTKSVKFLKEGQSFTFEALGYGVDTDDIVWTTTEKSIVNINKETGKATAKSKGVAYIIAKVKNITYKSKLEVK